MILDFLLLIAILCNAVPLIGLLLYGFYCAIKPDRYDDE
jgi:nitrogen fixation-related uncharacterized protein